MGEGTRIDMTRDELLKHVDESMGKHVGEAMRASEEKFNELNARMDALESTGTAGLARDAWLHDRNSSRPPIVDGSLEVDEIIDLERQRSGFGDVIEMTPSGIPVARALPSRSRSSHLRDKRGLKAMRAMRAMAYSAVLGDGRTVNYERAIGVAQREWGDRTTAGVLEEARDLAKALMGSDLDAERAERALGTTTLGSGGGLVQTEVWSEFIDYLWPRTLVRSLGVRSIPLRNSLDVLFWDTATTASYVGESVGSNATQPGEGRLKFARKIIQGIAALTRELMAESDLRVDDMLREMLLMSISDLEETYFIRGQGDEYTPRGMSFWADYASNTQTRSLDTVPTVATITADAQAARVALEEGDISRIDMEAMFTIMSIREFWYLATLRNSTTAQYVWPEFQMGQWYGTRARRSNKLPTNLAGDASGNGTGNKSEIYMGSAPTLAIAEAPSVEVNVFPGGAYKNSSGTLVSGITQREVVLEVAGHHDFGSLLRGKDIHRTDSVDYGA